MNTTSAGGVLEEDCEKLQAETLIERSLIIAANRGPVSLERAEDGSIVSHRGSGGLVTALSGLVQQYESSFSLLPRQPMMDITTSSLTLCCGSFNTPCGMYPGLPLSTKQPGMHGKTVTWL
jgi:trehalose-6-phosphate synthase